MSSKHAGSSDKGMWVVDAVYSVANGISYRLMAGACERGFQRLDRFAVG